MKLPRAVFDCERRSMELLSARRETPFGARYEDDILPDMADYNFTWFSEGIPAKDLPSLFRSELENYREQGKPFCKFVLEAGTPVEGLPQPEGIPAPELSKIFFYLLDPAKAEKLQGAEEAQIRLVNNRERAQELAALDLLNNREAFGEEFCRRLTRRRVSIYLSDSPINSYLCCRQGEPVGSCTMSVISGTAKIEELYVLESCRGMGCGTAILREMASRAVSCGAETVYLKTGAREVSEELCRSLGLTAAGERIEVLYRL